MAERLWAGPAFNWGADVESDEDAIERTIERIYMYINERVALSSLGKGCCVQIVFCTHKFLSFVYT